MDNKESTRQSDSSVTCFLETIKKIKAGALSLKKKAIFSPLNFSPIENDSSILVKLYDYPCWIDTEKNTLTTFLGNVVSVSEKVANRILYNCQIEINLDYPIIEHNGTQIRIKVGTYFNNLNAVKYKYYYSTGDFLFSMKNLGLKDLEASIDALLKNKPLPKTGAKSNDFMYRLNLLSNNKTQVDFGD